MRNGGHVRHSTERAPRRREAVIRGKIYWPDTIRGRLSGKVPQGTYITSRVEKVADIPESQLLKHFLQQVAYAADTLSRLTSGGSLPPQIAAIRQAAHASLANPHLSAVSSVPAVTAQMVLRALRHKNPAYGSAARHWSDFRGAVELGKWPAIMNLMQEGWVAPISEDDLFELYALALTLDTLEVDLKLGPPRLGLIKTGRRAIAEFNVGGNILYVYFNQSPNTFISARSRYVEMVSAHDGISGSERRPDITLRLSSHPERRMIIEVKRTSDAAYISNSVYKVYGYLHDFADMWQEEQNPKAVLFFPTPVHLRDPLREIGKHELVATSDRPGLANAIVSALGLAAPS